MVLNQVWASFPDISKPKNKTEEEKQIQPSEHTRSAERASF